MKKIAIVSLISSAIVVAGMAFASVQTFRIAGERNSATVESNTTVENFTGRTNKVTGEIRFDPQAKKGSGIINVDAMSISTGIGGRDTNMRKPEYMNFTAHPQIRFEASSVKFKTGDQYDVVGRMTMSGKTVALTVPVTLRLITAGAATKELGFEGDVVNLRTSFPIKLSDFGVVLKGQAATSVSSTPTIQLNVFASNK
jgi:polyisoprenoid-binding protein YceI